MTQFIYLPIFLISKKNNILKGARICPRVHREYTKIKPTPQKRLTPQHSRVTQPIHKFPCGMNCWNNKQVGSKPKDYKFKNCLLPWIECSFINKTLLFLSFHKVYNLRSWNRVSTAENSSSIVDLLEWLASK